MRPSTKKFLSYFLINGQLYLHLTHFLSAVFPPSKLPEHPFDETLSILGRDWIFSRVFNIHFHKNHIKNAINQPSPNNQNVNIIMRRFVNCLQIVIVKENTDAKMLRGSQRRTKIKSVKNHWEKVHKRSSDEPPILWDKRAYTHPIKRQISKIG